MLALVIFLSLVAAGRSQLSPMFLGAAGVPYENVQHMLLNNILESKPVMRYMQEYPVYEDGFWSEPSPNMQKCPAAEVYHLRREIEELHRRTRRIREEKLRQQQEVIRLREELKASLETTDHLQNGLYVHEQELLKLWRTVNERGEASGMDRDTVKELVSVLEKLEKFVDNVVAGYEQLKSKCEKHSDS